MTSHAAFVFLGVLAAVFGVVYFPVLNRMARGVASPYAKVGIRKRVSAAVIDASLVVIGLVGFRTQGSALFLLVAAIYLVWRDALFVQGQSIGKFLTGLVVIDLDTGRPCGRLQSAKRNFIFIVPGLNVVAVALEGVATFRDPQGQRLGDRIANTQVVEGFGAKDLVKDVLQDAMLEMELKRRGEKQPVETT
jgi:uncharacterized RDD family membrane protein YckC